MTGRRTSKPEASVASKVLASKTASKIEKSLAASVLAQRSKGK